MSSAAIAARLGCRRLRDADGGTLWECHDAGTVVRLLRELAEADVASGTVRTLAREIRRHAGAEAGPGALARVLHGYVLSSVRWQREDVETFQSARETLRRGFGDCDDHARLIFSVLRALGIRARLVILNNDKGEPAHAVTQALTEQGWTWLETSVPAKFGEAPLQAAARFGLHSRLNMPPGLSGLAGLVVNNGRVGFDGPIGVDVVSGAAVGAALVSPIGTAVGAVVGLLSRKGLGEGASIGSGVGAVVGAVAGGVFALHSRAVLAAEAPRPEGS